MTGAGVAMQVESVFRVDIDGDFDRDDFHEHGQRVMEALLDLERCNPDVTDSTVSTDTAERTITIGLLVRADVEDDAVAKVRGLMRSAIHTAGGFTPFWDEPAGVGHEPAVEYSDPRMTTARTVETV